MGKHLIAQRAKNEIENLRAIGFVRSIEDARAARSPLLAFSFQSST